MSRKTTAVDDDNHSCDRYEEEEEDELEEDTSTRGSWIKSVLATFDGVTSSLVPFQRNARENCEVLSNTQTFHMYSIAALADALMVADHDDDDDRTQGTSRRERTNARLFVFLSLALVSLQIMVLHFVNDESLCTNLRNEY